MKARSLQHAHEQLRDTATGDIPRGAIYRLIGTAQRGGEYNGQLIFLATITIFTAAGTIAPSLTAWIIFCAAGSFLLDDRSRRHKLALTALPGQTLLYGQLPVRAILDALPHYALAFAIYVCVFPLRESLQAPFSSFVVLYAFYMIIRLIYLAVYTVALTIGKKRFPLRVFQEQKANLRSHRVALKHVWWAYFTGNVGLVVKCAVQVITIGAFEWLRTRLNIDIHSMPALTGHATTLAILAVLIWPVAFWLSVQLSSIVYYRLHRTLHTCRPLYDSIHAIHHRGMLPTPLDSGTISPLEFLITDMARPAVLLVPNWLFVLFEMGLALGAHLPSHDVGTRHRFAQHHLDHHRYSIVNFGLLPSDDERWGTRYIAVSAHRDHWIFSAACEAGRLSVGARG